MKKKNKIVRARKEGTCYIVDVFENGKQVDHFLWYCSIEALKVSYRGYVLEVDNE